MLDEAGSTIVLLMSGDEAIREARFSRRRFSAASTDSDFLCGFTGDNVSSPSSPARSYALPFDPDPDPDPTRLGRSPRLLPSISFPPKKISSFPLNSPALLSASLSEESSSSSSAEAENGNRPMASSTIVIPSDQTSDLTVYGSPEIRSGCTRNFVSFDVLSSESSARGQE